MLLLAAALVVVSDELRLPAVADVSICIHPSERTFNTGGATRLRLKGNEHILLLDFDAKPLAGLRVAEARLYLHAAAPHKLKTLGVSTVAAPWKEGEGRGPARKGEVCFLEAAREERPWPGGDFLAVTFGRGGSEWRTEDLREEGDGWFSVAVPPEFVGAIGAGRSLGLAVSDEKGQTRWNNDVHSREEGGLGPLLVVRTEAGEPAPLGLPPSTRAASDPRPSPPFVLPPPPSPRQVAPLALEDGCRLVFLAEGAQADPRGDLPTGPLHEGFDGRTLDLRAARGEHLGATLAVAVKPGETIRPLVRANGPEGVRARVFAAPFVPAEPHPLADPLVPLEPSADPVRLPVDPGERLALFYLEWFVPPATLPEPLEGEVLVRCGEAQVAVPVSIGVVDALLPASPTFTISLNTYGFPGADREEERRWFRLAHENRATLAPVPYSQSGRLGPGCAPETIREGDRVRVTSWKEWDERFGPLLDGSAFRGLPREGTPLDYLFLPLHENWPLPIGEFYRYRGTVADHWRDAPPIEEAFPEAYGRAFADMTAEFARHLGERGWTETKFLGFLNNKVDYRERGRGASWWLLDEPAWRDDFLALHFFARRFREGTSAAKSPANMLFRVDLSRPQWRREHLDGLVDLVVCNAIGESDAVALEKARRFGETLWSYGETPFASPAGDACRAWCLRAWLDGADGMVPWQCVGSPEAWSRPEPTALLYPAAPGLGPGPFPSLRLKMLRRAAEDVEILNLLLARGLASREAIARAVGPSLDGPKCERLRLAALDLLTR